MKGYGRKAVSPTNTQVMKKMSITFTRRTPRTNWITVALLVVLVTGFGAFAEGRARDTDAMAHSDIHEVQVPSIARAIFDHL